MAKSRTPVRVGGSNTLTPKQQRDRDRVKANANKRATPRGTNTTQAQTNQQRGVDRRSDPTLGPSIGPLAQGQRRPGRAATGPVRPAATPVKRATKGEVLQAGAGSRDARKEAELNLLRLRRLPGGVVGGGSERISEFVGLQGDLRSSVQGQRDAARGFRGLRVAERQDAVAGPVQARPFADDPESQLRLQDTVIQNRLRQQAEDAEVAGRLGARVVQGESLVPQAQAGIATGLAAQRAATAGFRGERATFDAGAAVAGRLAGAGATGLELDNRIKSNDVEIGRLQNEALAAVDPQERERLTQDAQRIANENETLKGQLVQADIEAKRADTARVVQDTELGTGRRVQQAEEDLRLQEIGLEGQGLDVGIGSIFTNPEAFEAGNVAMREAVGKIGNVLNTLPGKGGTIDFGAIPTTALAGIASRTSQIIAGFNSENPLEQGAALSAARSFIESIDAEGIPRGILATRGLFSGVVKSALNIDPSGSFERASPENINKQRLLAEFAESVQTIRAFLDRAQGRRVAPAQ